MRHISKALFAASALAAAMLVGAGAAQAQEPDTHNAVYFTFSQSVVLPNLTLPAGKYLFQVTSGPAARDVVVVYTGDRSKALGFLPTVPIHRDTPPDNPEIRFMEAAAGAPAPIQSYFFPGTRIGWEFVYSRAQALQIAKAAKEPVLTTAKAIPTKDAKSADLEFVTAGGQGTAFSENSAEPVASVAQRGEVAPAAAPAQRPAAAAAAAAPAPAPVQREARAEAPARTKLPTTASALPLVALGGLWMLLLGLALGFWRRRLA